MVACCAVNCKNHSNNKELKGKVSFHDLPVIVELRAKWLRNICRANWEPKETDKLCSSHFLPSDYRTGVKHRILLPNAIPTVFKDYPSSVVQTTQTRKLPIASNSYVQPDDTVLAIPLTNVAVTQCTVETRNVATITEPDKCDPTALRARRRELQKDLKLAMLRRQVKAQRQQILRMRSKISTCEQDIVSLKQTVEKARAFKYTEIVEKIIKAAENRDLTAMLLKNQIDAFVRQRVSWKKKLLLQCMLWHKCSPRGYNYARKNKLLKLPNKSTLWRFVGSTRSKAVPTVLPKKLNTVQTRNAHMFSSQELLVPQTQDTTMVMVQELLVQQEHGPSLATPENLIMPQCQELNGEMVQVWTTLCASSLEGLGNPENGILEFVNTVEVE